MSFPPRRPSARAGAASLADSNDEVLMLPRPMISCPSSTSHPCARPCPVLQACVCGRCPLEYGYCGLASSSQILFFIHFPAFCLRQMPEQVQHYRGNKYHPLTALHRLLQHFQEQPMPNMVCVTTSVQPCSTNLSASDAIDGIYKQAGEREAHSGFLAPRTSFKMTKLPCPVGVMTLQQ
jgi:hypothetical protein